MWVFIVQVLKTRLTPFALSLSVKLYWKCALLILKLVGNGVTLLFKSGYFMFLIIYYFALWLPSTKKELRRNSEKVPNNTSLLQAMIARTERAQNLKAYQMLETVASSTVLFNFFSLQISFECSWSAFINDLKQKIKKWVNNHLAIFWVIYSSYWSKRKI